MDFTYLILIGGIALFSWLVSSKLKSKFAHYSKIHLRNGMSGGAVRVGALYLTHQEESSRNQCLQR